MKNQEKIIISIPSENIEREAEKAVVDYLISQVELYKSDGYDWIRMESIRNFSRSLFGTPGIVPEEFSVAGYDFKKVEESRYTFKKQ